MLYIESKLLNLLNPEYKKNLQNIDSYDREIEELTTYEKELHKLVSDI